MIDANTITTQVADKAGFLIHDPKLIITGIILIIGTILIIKFLKNVIVNSIIGVAGLLIANFVFGVKLPFVLTLIVSAIFGAAGLGVMLLLKFFGVV
jgi:hypothetical protein